MTQQPEALRLADDLDILEGSIEDGICREAAAELRRLHGRVTALERAGRQALEALDGVEALLTSMDVTHLLIYEQIEEAITALSERLAREEPTRAEKMREAGYTRRPSLREFPSDKPARQEQEQEPFGYFQLDLRLDAWVQNRDSNKGVAFYTAPQREWVGLSEEEIAVICGECAASAHRADDISYARAIEAKLREKNGI